MICGIQTVLSFVSLSISLPLSILQHVISTSSPSSEKKAIASEKKAIANSIGKCFRHHRRFFHRRTARRGQGIGDPLTRCSCTKIVRSVYHHGGFFFFFFHGQRQTRQDGAGQLEVSTGSRVAVQSSMVSAAPDQHAARIAGLRRTGHSRPRRVSWLAAASTLLPGPGAAARHPASRGGPCEGCRARRGGHAPDRPRPRAVEGRVQAAGGRARAGQHAQPGAPRARAAGEAALRAVTRAAVAGPPRPGPQGATPAPPRLRPPGQGSTPRGCRGRAPVEPRPRGCAAVGSAPEPPGPHAVGHRGARQGPCPPRRVRRRMLPAPAGARAGVAHSHRGLLQPPRSCPRWRPSLQGPRPKAVPPRRAGPGGWQPVPPHQAPQR
jgi:hypothetical protein